VNPIERLVRGLDRWQQRNRVVGLAFGVVKKFGDDRGGALAALIAYYAFMSLFPLLLVLTTILGFIGNDDLRDNVVGTALSEFPVVGEQIGEDASQPLTGNGVGLAVGLLLLVYGSLGVAQAGQHAMAQVWNVPGVSRPGFVPRLARSVGFFAVLALGLALTTGLSGAATMSGRDLDVRAASLLVSALVNVALYIALFRVLTPRTVPMHDLAPGAALAGLCYAALLALGTSLVQHQLRHAQALYGQFALVLGLIGWLYLVAQIIVYAAELNVVRARRLWPRSIVQPPLTPADERVLRDIARQEERRPEQRVAVGFEPDAAEKAAADARARSEAGQAPPQPSS
jgi:YihY family inner membrane protein